MTASTALYTEDIATDEPCDVCGGSGQLENGWCWCAAGLALQDACTCTYCGNLKDDPDAPACPHCAVAYGLNSASHFDELGRSFF